jgi:predicted ferric reductase
MATQTWWYVARAGGLVAWTLLVASTVWGTVLATRAFGQRVTAVWMLEVHRYLAALAIAFTGVHLLGLVADDFVSFSWADVLLPMASGWRPLAVTWGIVGLYLLVVVEITSVFRQHLSPRAWRAIHLSSYALFGVTTIHLLTAGTDSQDVLPDDVAVGLGVAAVFLAVLLLVWRSAPRYRPAPAQEGVRDDLA